MTPNAIRMRHWRARNPERAREINRESYRRTRKKRLAEKQAYYQRVRKKKDKTAVGRQKDREKKARQRARAKELKCG